MNVAFASPLGLPRDGVAIPARELVGHLGRICTLTHLPLDAAVHDRGHFRRLAEAANRCDLLHVEHTHGFFRLPLYPFREAFLDFLGRVRVPRLVVFHEPFGKVPVFRPYGGPGLAGRARRELVFAAMRAARPLADALWVPWYNRRIFSVPERVVVHTRYREALVRRFAPEARTSVIPAPVYGPRERPPGGAGIRLPFGEGDVVLTVFGFIDRRKDHIGVARALLGLPANYKMLAAGGPFDASEVSTPASPYARFLDFVRENGLSERVHVTGFLPDEAIPDVMAASAFVVAPFNEDHSSGSINMGLAYSRPVIAYRTLLTEEMNENGAGLFLVDGWERLGPAILETGKDPARVARARELGAAYCESYGFPAQARAFASWYGEILASRRAGRGPR